MAQGHRVESLGPSTLAHRAARGSRLRSRQRPFSLGWPVQVGTPELQRTEADTADASAAPGPTPPPPGAPIAYRASLLVAIPDAPFSSQPNCRKSLYFLFRSIQKLRAAAEGVTPSAPPEAEAAAVFVGVLRPASLRRLRGIWGVGSGFGREDSAPPSLFSNRRRRVCGWGSVSNPASGVNCKTVWVGAAWFSLPR